MLSSTFQISLIIIETRVKERQKKLEKKDERTKERKRDPQTGSDREIASERQIQKEERKIKERKQNICVKFEMEFKKNWMEQKNKILFAFL